ncbi:MAG TPA: NmrA family NAD(P)-binding protein [Flavitalea sp.]|nr:NmrA family NAD(P)-binding protein [Flavitalea sp.]
MSNSIVVAGGTGNLGHRIIKALMDRGADVRAIVRPGSDKEKVNNLSKTGAKIVEVDMMNLDELRKVCTGASCLISALQGLREVIVDVQTHLLEAAVAARVPRFIPSDFAVDFTKINSENRNFDLRREFHKVLDKANISATSIYNGAFADILTYNTPILDLKNKSAGYWGEKADWHLDFTTMDNTADYTAAAALDSSTPRSLHIASFQVNANDLALLATEITKTKFSVKSMGSLEQFAGYIKQQRLADPEGEKSIFPKWQNGQYMHDQFSTHHEKLDNNRYPQIKWTSAKDFMSSWLH